MAPAVQTRTSSSPRTEASGRSVWLVLDLEAKKRGSLEEQLLALGRRLHDAGVSPTFVFASEPPDWLRAAYLDCGVHVRAVDFRRPLLATLQLGRWLRAARPALVHFHFVRAQTPIVAAARLCGARVIVHDHMALGVAFIDVRPRPPALQAAARAYKRARGALMNPLVDQRVAVSDFVARSVRDTEFVPDARLTVIEHGIDLGRFDAVDGARFRQELGAGDRPVVACVSRLAPEKGVDVLVRAHARLGRGALLVIAGDGPETERCRRLAEELGAADRVRFLGLVRDVPRVLGGCDVAVVPSLAPEAFGLAVVEAMAAGKPVVVSDAGALPDIIDHGRCGVVVPRGDAAAMADAIGRLLDGPVFAAQLGAAGRARARARHDLGGWVERVLALYARTLPSLGKVASGEQAGQRPLAGVAEGL